MTSPHPKLSGVRITGIASAVPEAVAGVEELRAGFPDADVDKITKSIGVITRHIADAETTTSDLCLAAARKLLADTQIDPNEIDLVVFVSQTPDYILPATSCVIHGHLGLRRECAAFDINLGCSGYTYGLWTVGHLLKSSGMRRALLLAGDTVSKICNPADKSVMPVFGDAGTATLLEADPTAEPIAFALGTDGKGVENLIVPAGGFRQARTAASGEAAVCADGNVRSQDDLYMNGAEIFAFTLREVPALMAEIFAASGWSIEDTDYFVFHQANDFMLEHLRKRLKVPADKFVKSLGDYGNTSSASIPLALNHKLKESLQSGPKKLVLAGFGVGYSWAAAAVTLGPETVLSEIVEVPSK